MEIKEIKFLNRTDKKRKSKFDKKYHFKNMYEDSAYNKKQPYKRQPKNLKEYLEDSE
jgi:hypothetical protein